MLNGVFAIGTEGMLELPIIGRVPAAGLHANELAKLITDRLQARSGFSERAVTTIQRQQSGVASDPTDFVGRLPEAQLSENSPRAPVEPTATEPQDLNRERSRVAVLLRDLSAARIELERVRGEALAARQAAHDVAVRNHQGLAAERQRTAALIRELGAARANLEALKTQMAQQANAASQAGQVAKTLANREHEQVARERAKAAVLEHDLLAARRQIDALTNGRQTAAEEREKALRSELAAARGELGTIRQAARDATARSLAVADAAAEQKRALEEQSQKAKGLARDLSLAQREVERLKAKSALVDRQMGAARAARLVAEASLSDARRTRDEERHKAELLERDLAAARQSIDALEASANLAAAAQGAALQDRQVAEASLTDATRTRDEERHKAELLERDLAAARQSIDALEASANLAAAAQGAALQERQVAEAAAKRISEQLALERRRADSAVRDLDIARRERDAAKQEVTRILAALKQESDRALSAARDLAAARKEIDALKARTGRRIARIENVPKKRATNRTTRRSDPPLRAAVARSASEPEALRIHKVIRKSTRAVRLSTIVLPDALLPTRPPN